MTGELCVAAPELLDWASAIFERLDLPPEDARLVADTLVEAEMRGVYSHGVFRVPEYVVRLRAGGCVPRPHVRIVQETAATALVDGGHGLGQVVSRFAMAVALEKAQSVGSSHIAVFNSSHNGAEAYWAMQAIERDMIGIAASLSAGNIMAPWGGRAPLLGNNPIAYAIPAGSELPVVLDLATSVVAKGKIMVAAQEGRPIPPDWALDAEGRPTTDPVAAAAGLVQPIAGYKGSGLSFVFGVLGGLLSGADFGPNVHDLRAKPAAQHSIGHFFQAINISSFRPVTEFKVELDRIIEVFKSSQRVDGVEEILMPGEVEFRRRDHASRNGIALSATMVEELNAVAAELGVGAIYAG